MLVAMSRMLAVAGVAMALAATVLGALSQTALAVAALALSIGAFGAGGVMDRRESGRLLRSQRTAQQAGYERMRLVLESLEAIRSQQSIDDPVTHMSQPLDARSEDLSQLVADADAGARVLLIGGARPVTAPADVVAVDVLELGDDALCGVPHGLHTHVLIEPESLSRCTDDEVRWLQRLFRWQHDTIIAIPRRVGGSGRDALSTVVGAPLAVERRGRLIALWAPLGGGVGWGRA